MRKFTEFCYTESCVHSNDHRYLKNPGWRSIWATSFVFGPIGRVTLILSHDQTKSDQCCPHMERKNSSRTHLCQLLSVYEPDVRNSLVWPLKYCFEDSFFDKKQEEGSNNIPEQTEYRNSLSGGFGEHSKLTNIEMDIGLKGLKSCTFQSFSAYFWKLMSKSHNLYSSVYSVS